MFLKLIEVNSILNISEITGLNLMFQTIVFICSVFTILFLPTYPIFFVLLKKTRFKPAEKLGLTIVLNSAFYIFLGYIGYWVNIPLTGFFFFYFTLIFYFLLVIYITLTEWKKGEIIFFRGKESELELEKIYLWKILKKRISITSILLVTFIVLVCIFNVIRFNYFVGTDPWLHILNGRIITDLNVLPLENYHGTMGINIFGAVVSFFSGLSHVLIPKFFIFYNLFLSAILFYSILIRIFKNQKFAILGVFILESTSLGFPIMMLQYWPSGSALIKCLAIFLLLYIRMQDFIKKERPTKIEILSNISIIYSVIAVIFISAVLTHVILSFFFLFSFLFLYFIYFLKDYRRGFDLIFLIGIFGIFLILNMFGIGSGHYWFFIPLDISWYYLVLIALVGCTAGGILLWRIRKSINFTKGRYKSTIKGQNNTFYKHIEDKIIVPFIFGGFVISLVITLIIDILMFDFGIINVFYVSEIILLSVFAIWGLLIFQKKPKGKFLFIWGTGLVLLLVVGIIFNFFILSNMIWQRILYIMPPIIVIGFISYIHKMIKIRKLETPRMKSILLFIITFSLLSNYFYESASFEIFYVKRRDINPIQWYSINTVNESLIIAEFGWNHIFRYYNYPFDEGGENLLNTERIYFIKYKVDLFSPQNHINESSVNVLKEIKNSYKMDVYLMFAGEYIINKGFDLFGKLSDEQLEEYYNLPYLNKICSSKTKSGAETPLYWVI
ncbi:MAG: hypothetical protein ACW99E_12905 [Promethearchaeota archaeon]